MQSSPARCLPNIPLPQLLADCYYVNGQRNRTYREAVNAVFGRKGDIILGWCALGRRRC